MNRELRVASANCSQATLRNDFAIRDSRLAIQKGVPVSDDFRFSPLVIRGVHVDCRAQMLRFERIVEIFHDLARWGFNTVLLEYEDRFPYSGRLQKLAAEDALTAGQVRRLDALAKKLGLSIIPLVQCLGHLEYVLQFPQFRRLADGRGERQWPSTLCPSDGRGLKLFQEMAGQVLAMHPDSRYFHMGGDEAKLNPDCPRCAARRRTAGISRMLVDHYVRCADWIRPQGPEPVIWGDLLLAHPEALDLVRGHATIMDWNYWDGLRPGDRPRPWGEPRKNPTQPRSWPEAHRKLFPPYLFTKDGQARPFPYTPFLRDRGFPVIIASAIRSSGDSFCVPKPRSVENVMGAAVAAAESHVLGSVITSWALRRAPWPLTEHALIAGAMTMKDPRVSRGEIDAAFALEHFGLADARLAKISALLGESVWGLVDSRPRFTGLPAAWYGLDAKGRIEYIQKDLPQFRRQLAALKRSIPRAEALLAKARPMSKRQKQRVALWRWAADVLKHFVELGPELLKAPGKHDAKRLAALNKSAKALAQRTEKLLSPIYTARTMREELQTRFGSQREFLEKMTALSAVD